MIKYAEVLLMLHHRRRFKCDSIDFKLHSRNNCAVLMFFFLTPSRVDCEYHKVTFDLEKGSRSGARLSLSSAFYLARVLDKEVVKAYTSYIYSGTHSRRGLCPSNTYRFLIMCRSARSTSPRVSK